MFIFQRRARLAFHVELHPAGCPEINLQFFLLPGLTGGKVCCTIILSNLIFNAFGFDIISVPVPSGAGNFLLLPCR